MIDAWNNPETLFVGGREWKIRTDYRDILYILKCFRDPEYEDVGWDICLDILYIDFAEMPAELWDEAVKQASEFIDMGIKDDGKQKLRLMDWEQDAPILAAPISKNLGHDVRSPEPLHWWTFLSAYLDIRECLYSQVLNIRYKRAKHTKLEKHEQEFYQNNKSLIDLNKERAERSEEETAALRELFGLKK